MKEQKFYFLKCTAKKECKYPRVTIQPGEVLYYTSKPAAREMSQAYGVNPYGNYQSYLPFTRNPQHARKWQKFNVAKSTKEWIESKGEYDVEIITITVKYEETYE